MVQVLALHQFDCARANKSTASWGVEARVPFLDVDFIEEAMMTNPEDKMVAPVSNSASHDYSLVGVRVLLRGAGHGYFPRT